MFRLGLARFALVAAAPFALPFAIGFAIVFAVPAMETLAEPLANELAEVLRPTDVEIEAQVEVRTRDMRCSSRRRRKCAGGRLAASRGTLESRLDHALPEPFVSFRHHALPLLPSHFIPWPAFLEIQHTQLTLYGPPLQWQPIEWDPSTN
jgi:hypothetical protein